MKGKCKYELVFNRQNKLNKQKKALIQIRVYQNTGAKQINKYFSTNIYVETKQWNENKKQIINHANAANLNRQINDLLASFEKFELSYINSGKDFNIYMFKDYVKGKNTSYFDEFFKTEIEQIPMKESSRKTYLATLNKLTLYKEKILFEELNFNFIDDFNRWLLKKNLHVNTVHRIHKQIKYILNLAIKKGYFDMNKSPYNFFKAKSINSDRKPLTEEQVYKIANYEFSENYEYLNKIRDYFMFLIYTGLRYSDFISLRRDNFILNGENYFLEKKLEKTKTTSNFDLYLPLSKEALEIFLKYKEDGKEYIFNDFTNQYFNRELKKIQILCEIKRPLTAHVARHTFATYLLGEGVRLETVSKLLGHSNIKTTQEYAKVLKKQIDEELNKVNFNFKNTKK